VKSKLQGLTRKINGVITKLKVPAQLAKSAPERWHIQATDAATATLLIPADAARTRRFEIACAMTVAVPADGTATSPWHQLTVLANGTRQWQRQVPSANPGAWDGLDYRFSRTVPVGQALRITASVAVHGVRRRSLVLEADEV
jgi:hypothetical protein